MKNFVGGYYDRRIFEGEEFIGKTPFGKDINTYSFEEVLRLPFVEIFLNYIIEQYEEDGEKWEDATEEEKAQAIISFVESDEIAGLLYFETEEEAEKYKQEVIKEIEEIEEMSVFDCLEQDGEGGFREVYVYKEI